MKQARMIIAIILFGLIPLVLCIAKDKPVDPNQVIDPNVIIEQEALEVESMVKELPVKEKELNEKIYTDITAEQFYIERLADVNELSVFVETLNTKAIEVSEKLKIDDGKKSRITAILSYIQQKKTTQKNNVKILGIISEYATDPNGMPDATDPNYLTELNRRKDLLEKVTEICSPK